MPPRVDVLGCPVDAIDLDAAVRQILRLARGSGPMRWVMPVNAAKIVAMRRDPVLRQMTHEASLVVADGASILAAARRRGTPLPGRVTGVDLMGALLAQAKPLGLRTFLLGARPEVVRRAAARVGADGYHHGYFEEEGPVREAIERVAPHLLFVALGSPRQEHLLHRFRDLPVPFAMGVGGGVDVLAGAVRRAPEWIGRWGLEWAWRVTLEPRKRWRRGLLDSARFVRDELLDRRLPPWEGEKPAAP